MQIKIGMVIVMEPSKRVQSINLSEIRKMFEMAGEDSINLGLGEPDFNTPKHIIEAASTCHERWFHPLHIKHGNYWS